MKKTLFVMLLASLLVFSFISCSDSPSTEVLTSLPEEANTTYMKIMSAFDKAIQPINGGYMAGVVVEETKDPYSERYAFTEVNVYGDGVKLNGEATNTSTSSKIDLTYGTDSVSFTSKKGDEVIVLTINGKSYTVSSSWSSNNPSEPEVPVEPETPDAISGENLTKVQEAFCAVLIGIDDQNSMVDRNITKTEEEVGVTYAFNNSNIDGVIITSGSLHAWTEQQYSKYDADVTYNGTRIELLITYDNTLMPVEDTIIVSLDGVKYSVSVSDIIAQA